MGKKIYDIQNSELKDQQGQLRWNTVLAKSVVPDP